MKEFRAILYDGSNVVLQKSFALGVKLIKLSATLKSQKEFDLSRQLVRSGTSIGANLMESQYGASRKDFVSKLRIALKEANETLYRIELLYKSDFIKLEYEILYKEISTIIALLLSSVKTIENT